MSRSLRTKKMQIKYNERLESLNKSTCRLCEMPSLKEFKYWRVLENEFPYDMVADKHVILVTKRHCSETDLSKEEKDELLSLKKTDYVNDFQFIFESTPGTMSIPAHYHLHLMRIKDF